MNTNERPTPETDAETHDDWSGGAEAVDVDFARRLERQRDEARDRIAELEKQLEDLREPNEPETFQAHGLTWIKHTPGDPMPCYSRQRVKVLLTSGRMCGDDLEFYAAEDLDWSLEPSTNSRIIGWNYADAS